MTRIAVAIPGAVGTEIRVTGRSIQGSVAAGKQHPRPPPLSSSLAHRGTQRYCPSHTLAESRGSGAGADSLSAVRNPRCRHSGIGAITGLGNRVLIPTRQEAGAPPPPSATRAAGAGRRRRYGVGAAAATVPVSVTPDRAAQVLFATFRFLWYPSHRLPESLQRPGSAGPGGPPPQSHGHARRPGAYGVCHGH